VLQVLDFAARDERLPHGAACIGHAPGPGLHQLQKQSEQRHLDSKSRWECTGLLSQNRQAARWVSVVNTMSVWKMSQSVLLHCWWLASVLALE